jgi:hypothetical protein
LRVRAGSRKYIIFVFSILISLEQKNNVHFVTHVAERNRGFRVMYLDGGICTRECNAMAGFYLGIAVAGVNALVAMGLVTAVVRLSGM